MAKDADERLLYLHYIVGLRTFLALYDLKLDRVALLQALVAIAMDGAVVYKHVRTIVPTNKAKTFCVIEPFYGSL